MKKLKCVLIVLVLSVSFAQAQTMKRVMYEGFTSANCPPCVPNNAAIKPILAANPTKVVALKYHTPNPGGPDFANQNTNTWVVPRLNYYSVTAVPTTRVNGTGTSMNQAVINQQYTNTSPFFLEVNHTFNADSSQIEVEVKIRAAQDYTGSQMVLHLAMVEKLITFATAPGGNGETEFNDVMRRMYPNASGTSLSNTWTNEQEQVLNFTVDVPTYIYKKSQIAFVSFVQSNTTKQVLQAAKSMKEIDGVVLSHNLSGDPVCGDSFAISFLLINSGKNDLSSLEIQYGEIGGEQQVFEWTGTLLHGQESTITLPPVKLSKLSDFAVKLINPNGVEDLILAEFEGKAFSVNEASFVPIMVEENFSSAIFPPENWSVSTSSGTPNWRRHTTGGGSAMVPFFNISQGPVDNLYVKPVDLRTDGEISLEFKVAHAMYGGSYGPNDRLQVQVSTNCGANWATVFNKAGANLATAPNTTASFVPNASQWRTETVDLSAYKEHQNVLVRFVASSGYGNNLYIDDVKIEATSYLVFIEVDGTGGNISAHQNGNPIESGASVLPGSEVVFTAHPDDNFLVDYWTVNGEVIDGGKESQITISNIHGLQEVKVAFRVDNTNIPSIGQPAVRVFPIPARTLLQVVSEEEIQQLTIFNVAGQEVYSSTGAGLNYNVNVGNLGAGFYVLIIKTQRGFVTKKIQVE